MFSKYYPDVLLRERFRGLNQNMQFTLELALKIKLTFLGPVI
jgi:hypothetical protein